MIPKAPLLGKININFTILKSRNNVFGKIKNITFGKNYTYQDKSKFLNYDQVFQKILSITHTRRFKAAFQFTSDYNEAHDAFLLKFECRHCF